MQRDEIFLGNVLLNDFLNKALLRAMQTQDVEGALVLNDIENAYFLVRGAVSLESVREGFHADVVANLAELYLGNENMTRGIFGKLEIMLTFYKSNIEPYPAFVVPRALLPRLLERVGEILHLLVSERGAHFLAETGELALERAETRRINVLLAIMGFFFGISGAEMQSPHKFLTRAMEQGLLPQDKVKRGFGFNPHESFTKEGFDQHKTAGTLDWNALDEAITHFVNAVNREIQAGGAEKIASNLADKLLDMPLERVADALLGEAQLSYLGAAEQVSEQAAQPCRFCGQQRAAVIGKNIVAGFGAGRFFNQASKIDVWAELICVRCALASYLVTKALGMHIAKPQPKSKDFPVPKLYNLIFHYGRHDDAEVTGLRQAIDFILKQAKENTSRDELLKQIAEMREAQARERRSQDREALTAAERLALLDESFVETSLEIVRQMSGDIQAQVLPLGTGEYRLFVFILPQLRPGQKEGLDFVQRRFSNSRLAVYTLLALLRGICGCDGAWYFQSVPELNTEQPNTFYVGGVAENADEALRRYGAITDFARRVSKFRQGHSPLVPWTLLAEDLLDDSLGTLSNVMRNSPIRGGDDYDKAKFKRLNNNFVLGMGVVDSIEYLKLYEHLKHL